MTLFDTRIQANQVVVGMTIVEPQTGRAGIIKMISPTPKSAKYLDLWFERSLNTLVRVRLPRSEEVVVSD